MKFQDLTINQTFTMTEYPDCIGVKTRPFAGSCCTPPSNAKLICDVEGKPQEKIVLLDEDQEVVPQPSEVATQPALLKNPTVLKTQLDNKVLPTGVKRDSSSIKERQPVEEKPRLKVKGLKVGDSQTVKKDKVVRDNPGGGTFGG